MATTSKYYAVRTATEENIYPKKSAALADYRKQQSATLYEISNNTYRVIVGK